MNQPQLLQHFDTLAESPEAIGKIRALILDLGVQGRLLPHDFSEQKPRLKKSITATTEQNKLMFSLPKNWIGVQLGDAISLEYGDSLPAKDRNTAGSFLVYGSNGVVGTHDSYLVESPCIVVGRKGSSGAVNLAQARCWPTDVTYYVVPPDYLDLRFTFLLLKSLRLELLGRGIKPGLNRNEAYRLPIAIPPLPEQTRIVMKVDELLSLCDELEKRQNAASEIGAKLLDSLIHHTLNLK